MLALTRSRAIYLIAIMGWHEMTVTANYYNKAGFNQIAPLLQSRETTDSIIRLNFRILTRQGDVVIDFGEFKDLLSYNDNLSLRGGNFVITMAALASNERLLRSVHPGMVIEFYACRNDDPLKGVSRESVTPPEGEKLYEHDTREIEGLAKKPKAGEESEIEDKGWSAPTPVSPAKKEEGQSEENSGEQPSNPSSGNGAVNENPSSGQSGAEPQEQDYLDRAPYLLLRGIIEQHGVNSALDGTTLTISGSDYGGLYRKSPLLVDIDGTNFGAYLQSRIEIGLPDKLDKLYYRILRDFVETFWGPDFKDTGWIARTRLIRNYKVIFARIPGDGGSAMQALESLAPQGLFDLFCDHTGAICWEKKPYSSNESPRRIEQFVDFPVDNWEDRTLLEIPTWKIERFMERIGTRDLANYSKVKFGMIAGASGTGSVPSGLVINKSSIAQYGLQQSAIQFPFQMQTSMPKEERKKLNKSIFNFSSLIALETITWRDRPVAAAMVQCRGEAYYRLYNRVRIKGSEYLIIKRSHTIDIQSGSWRCQMDIEGDRRKRYLGIGNQPEESEEEEGGEERESLFEPDEYEIFDPDKESDAIKGKFTVIKGVEGLDEKFKEIASGSPPLDV